MRRIAPRLALPRVIAAFVGQLALAWRREREL
jgi:hypothetical protein